MRIFDISVRISQVGKREPDRLYSDDNQEKACREQAEKEGGNVGIVTVEKNVSGGKAAKKRQLEKLIKRVEDKISNGIIVYDFSRFTREEPWSAMMLVGRVHLAGGVVIGVADNYRSDAPYAAVMTALYAEQAHNYIKVAREKTRSSHRAALERGAYIAKTPNCYGRGSGGELVESELSWLPQKIFERKLSGDSIAEIHRYAVENGLNCTVGAIRKMLTNPVYIGESQSGPSPVIVDRETYFDVQAMWEKRSPTATGKKTLGQGFARCANCDSTMIAQNSGSYYCRGQKIGGCTKRGSISIRIFDAWLESLFLDRAALADRIFRAYHDDTASSDTEATMQAKKFELDEIKKSTSLISTLGIAEFERMVSEAQGAYDMAALAFSAARENADLIEGWTTIIEAWKSGRLTLDHKRRLVTKAISHVEVGTGRVPVEQKCRVILPDGSVFAPDNAGPLLTLVEDRSELAS